MRRTAAILLAVACAAWLSPNSAAAQPGRSAMSDPATKGAKLARQGRFDEALRWLDLAVRQQPENVDARLNRGLVLAELGQHSRAIVDLQIVAAAAPRDPVPQLVMGYSHDALGQLPEALVAFIKACEGMPNQAEPWINRALLHARLGQLAEAVTNLDKAITLEPTDPMLRWNRATLRLRLGRGAEAATDAAEVVRRAGWSQPLTPYAAILQVLGLRQAGRLSDAAKAATTATDACPAERWPCPMLHLAAGRAEQTAVLTTGEEAGKSGEAQAYVGLWLLWGSDATAANQLLDDALATAKAGSLERDLVTSVR